MIATTHEYRGYVFTIEQVEEAYSIDFPDLPEIITSGETLPGAFANACEALDLHLECLRAAEVPIPQPWHRIQVRNDVPQVNLATNSEPRGMERQAPGQPARWFQFGLKTALLAMLAAAATSAWIATQRELAAQRQQIADFRIEMAEYKRKISERSLTRDEIYHTQGMVSHIREQLQEVTEKYRNVLTDLGELRTQGARIVDDQTVVIGSSWTGGDRRLLHLQAVEDLRNLHIADTKITDDAVMHLSALDGLQELQLTNTGLTIAGWRRMNNLGRLRILHLGGSEVTDEWLAPLADLSNLQQLMLTKTSVTPEAVENLKEQRPMLQIHLR